MGPNYGSESDPNAQGDEAARAKDLRDWLSARTETDRMNEEAMHEDALMLVGGKNQWPEDAVRERARLGRPLYTGNRFPAMLAQITGEIRKNRPSITCKPGDGDATAEAAEVFEGLIRSIERLSHANLVYARAGKSAAAVGKGHMRIVPVYADDESFDVELRIRAIKNVYSVKWGPHQEPDQSDATRCVIISELDKKDFEEAYPNVQAGTFETIEASQRKLADSWGSGRLNTVKLAEEWVVKREPYQRHRAVHSNGGVTFANGQPMQVQPTNQEITIDGDVGAQTIDGVDAQQFLQQMQTEGWQVVQTRTAYKKKICMYLWAGDTQIAGPIEWKGSRIPIFTVLGEEIDVGGETIVHGIIRHAKDAQRLHNYARAADLELVGQAPKAPIIIADEQLDGFEDEWALAQKQPVPYLRYNHVQGLPSPNERSGPGTNPGPQSLAQSGIVDMQDVVGIHDASLGKQSRETSGVAIEARDAQADTGTFVYLDNLNATIESIGSELVAAIPHYYSTQKQIMILGQDDAPAIIELSQIDLNLGKYHIICQRGPSYQTKREKAADMLIDMSRAAPPWAQPAIFKRVVKLTDVPDAEDFIAEIDAIGAMVGALPPPQAMQGGAPGMPPPGMPGQLPPNVIPMPPRGAPPMGPQPPNANQPLPPLRAPAAQTRVGPPPSGLRAPPGI